MKKIKLIMFTKYSKLGASSRLRTFQYIRGLEGANFKVTVSSLFTDIYLSRLYSGKSVSFFYILYRYLTRFFSLLFIARNDLVWIEKELFPYLPPFAEYILKWCGVKFIVDIDDAIFCNYEQSNNKLVRQLLSSKIDTVFRLSKHVTAGNGYLADRAFLAGAKEVTIVPTVVDTQRYPVYDRTPSSKVTVGWIGTPATEKYVILLASVFKEISEKYDIQLKLIGASKDVLNYYHSMDVQVINWTEDTEVYNLNMIDIGVMPLKDGLWEKGKCGYKLIQYMACGKPVVASDVGVNSEIVALCHAGYAVESHFDWLEKLEKLISDKEHRIELGKNARKGVESNFSVDSQLPVLVGIFNKSLK